MLKNNSLLGVVYGVLFFLILCVFLYSKYEAGTATIIFDYPGDDIEFAGEKVSMLGEDYYNKERFDKEFILASNNLYQFYLYAKRYPLYIPYVEAELEKADIPEDFKYLPIAESALRNDVISTAGAAGIWQFMPETAKRYGLIVNEYVDERYHFEKSTQAAISYLTDLYDKFGDWALVAAAYNRGENGLARDMESQNVDTYYDLYLNEETSRYVFRILSIKYVMIAYFEKKDFIDKIIGGVYSQPKMQDIRVSQIEDLSQWAKENGYNYKDIRVLNRWIIGDSLPEGEWYISVLQY